MGKSSISMGHGFHGCVSHYRVNPDPSAVRPALSPGAQASQARSAAVDNLGTWKDTASAWRKKAIKSRQRSMNSCMFGGFWWGGVPILCNDIYIYISHQNRQSQGLVPSSVLLQVVQWFWCPIHV